MKIVNMLVFLLVSNAAQAADGLIEIKSATASKIRSANLKQ